MAESGTPGLQQAREWGERAIEPRRPVTAFIGRALKGPLHRPVPVGCFADFQRLFGGLWQPSTLSYAVEQYFASGGRQALIVRVANGARAPTLTLPAGTGVLRLAGVHPGSREYLRASVDYDGIADQERFNLVLQRVRSSGSERVEDQEIFRRVSLLPAAERFLGHVLSGSGLARLIEPLPGERPDRSGSAGLPVGYTFSNSDGDDGGPLLDYDLIGSAAGGTGLFALRNEEFDFLCVPPLTRDQDVGLGTLLVATRLCRERHALLFVDPPSGWSSAQQAIECMRTWPFRSDSAVMCYPRVRAFDPLRGREEIFASCGAAAGLLSRAEETHAYHPTGDEWLLRLGLRPAVEVSDAQRIRLAQSGINALLAAKATDASAVSARTLAAGGGGSADWTYLSARRLALSIAASIERGTRWVLIEQNNPATWSRVRRLVDSFLETLAGQGAFAGASRAERYFVVCDERINDSAAVAAGRVNVLFGIAARRAGEFDTWLVSHDAVASRARAVSVNRLAAGVRILDAIGL